MLRLLFFCLYLLIILEKGFAEIQLFPINKDNPVVKIHTGFIRGRKDTTLGQRKPYYIFQGIPYAQPPVGQLRFEPPIPATLWTGIRDTQEFKSVCVQSVNKIYVGNATGSEDCLHLNVYTPYVGKKNLAVMVWIHGGSFYFGSGSPDEYKPDFLIDNDVVIVTINYRLGIFGFLSTGDMIVPGNAGLKDQLLALKWVKKNIDKFGGDPNKITLFGESAGGASILYHLTSTKSKGLFSGAIMESGTSLCEWSLSRKMRKGVELVGKAFNINTNSSRLLADAFKTIDAETLHYVSNIVSDNLQGTYREGFIFAPVPEPPHFDAFFTAQSHQLLTEGKFSSVPVLLGFNSMEMLLYSNVVNQFYLNDKITTYDFVPVDLNIENETEKQLVYNKIKEFYFGDKPVYNQTYQAYLFTSFDLFVRGTIEANRLLSKKTKTYLYEFSYVGNLSRFSNNPVPGASHYDEVPYIWRQDLKEPTTDDNLMRLRMTKLWTNFAKFRNPTPSSDPLLQNIKWYESDVLENNSLYIKLNKELEIGLNPLNMQDKFWQNIYKKHGYPPFDTY